MNHSGRRHRWSSDGIPIRRHALPRVGRATRSSGGRGAQEESRRTSPLPGAHPTCPMRRIPVEAEDPGLSALIIQNSIVVWERGMGRRDVESGAPALPDTPYLIGGLSQTFGATLLLRKCVDQWGAQLDDPVALRNAAYARALDHSWSTALAHCAGRRWLSLFAFAIRCPDAGDRALRAGALCGRPELRDLRSLCDARLVAR